MSVHIILLVPRGTVHTFVTTLSFQKRPFSEHLFLGSVEKGFSSNLMLSPHAAHAPLLAPLAGPSVSSPGSDPLCSGAQFPPASYFTSRPPALRAPAPHLHCVNSL